MSLIKIKNLRAPKKTMKKVKRQLTDWEEIPESHISDKGLVCRIYKELLKFNNKAINNPIRQWAKDLNRHFYCISKTYRWPTCS